MENSRRAGKCHGVDWIAVLLLAIVPIGTFVGATFDGTQRVRDIDGSLVWISNSNHADQITTIMVVILTLLATFRLIDTTLNKSTKLNLPAIAFLLPLSIIISQLIRSQYQSMLITSISTIVLIAIALKPWSINTSMALLRTMILAGISAAVFAFLSPQRGLIPCREDKCTPLGVLVTSYFPQENVLALYFMLGPVLSLIFLRGFRRVLVSSFFLALVCSSGSRAAISGSIAAVLIVFLFNLMKSEFNKKMFAKALGLVTTTLMLLSIVFFFYTKSTDAFTGRGSIYQLLRTYWFDSPLLGPGREILTIAFQKGESWNYLVAHEHGQLPYILINSGLIGALIFVSLFSKIGLKMIPQLSGKTRILAAAALCVSSLMFATEPFWQFDLRAPNFWSIAMIYSLCFTPAVKPYSWSKKTIESELTP